MSRLLCGQQFSFQRAALKEYSMRIYRCPRHAALCGLVTFLRLTFMALVVVAGEPVKYAQSIDVGQGTSTQLEFLCGTIVICAGGSGQVHVDSLVSGLKEFFTRRADINNMPPAVFAIHPHSDHARASYARWSKASPSQIASMTFTRFAAVVSVRKAGGEPSSGYPHPGRAC